MAAIGLLREGCYGARLPLLRPLHPGRQLGTNEVKQIGRPSERGPMKVHEAPVLQPVADYRDVAGVMARELVKAAQAEQQVLEAIARVLLQWSV